MSAHPIAIAVHSISAIPADLIAHYNIHVMYMQITYLRGNQDEPRGDLSTFYAGLEKEEVYPSSLPPSFGRYTAFFDQLLIEYDYVLMFHVSPTFSESYTRARDAAAAFNGRVIVYNTQSLGMGSGLHALTAARMVYDGAPIEAILERMRKQTQTTYGALVPATLRYLRNSRRIGSLAMTLAMFLSITPVIVCQHSKVMVIARTSSFQDGLDRMLEGFCKHFADAPPTEIAVTHTNAASVSQFYQRVQERFPGVPVYLSDNGPIFAVNSGPGGISIIGYRL